MTPIVRRAVAEFAGTALLLMAIVGSGIAAERLSPHDVGLQLLENSIATGAALVAIILAVGPLSGAHLNPAVTFADSLMGGMGMGEVLVYCVAQVGGGMVGAIVGNLMFSLPAVAISHKVRWGAGIWLGEVVATFGLLLVIFCLVRSEQKTAVAYAVGAYVTGAYWFTSSTSFANPAVTIARTLSDTFAGIAPASAPRFIYAQITGALLAVLVLKVVSGSRVTANESDTP